jgi:hypothetical protein
MNHFCKMVNKMNENFKHVFKFAHQPIYNSGFFQFSDIVSLASIPRGIQNSKKTSLKNVTKLNSKSKCGQKISNFSFQNLTNFSRILWLNISYSYYFSHLGEIMHLKKRCSRIENALNLLGPLRLGLNFNIINQEKFMSSTPAQLFCDHEIPSFHFSGQPHCWPHTSNHTWVFCCVFNTFLDLHGLQITSIRSRHFT